MWQMSGITTRQLESSRLPWQSDTRAQISRPQWRSNHSDLCFFGRWQCSCRSGRCRCFLSLLCSIHQSLSRKSCWIHPFLGLIRCCHSGINSYPHMTFHTVKVLIHTFTCHCILVLFHTKTCHFILATTCFIRIRNVSYVQILFHTFENLFHTYMYCFIRAHVISSYHTYIYCFIPTHVISYLRQPVSYVNVLFHTYTRDFRWNVCDQAHCTCVY